MKKFIFKYRILLMIVVFFFFAAAAEATPIITDLDVSNEDLGLVGVFATVSVDLTGTHTVTFRVDANESLFGVEPDTNFGIQRFGFNTGLALIEDDFSLPSGWSVQTTDSNISQFGLFNDDTSGTGNSRQDPLIFTITNAGIIDASQFFVANAKGYHYVAHIAGFPVQNGQTSAYFSDSPAAVPEPTTMILLGSGFLGLLRINRKK